MSMHVPQYMYGARESTHIEPKDYTLVLRNGGWYLYLLSHFPGPKIYFHCYNYYLEIVSLCSFCWPGTCGLDEAGLLQLRRGPPASASRVLMLSCVPQCWAKTYFHVYVLVYATNVRMPREASRVSKRPLELEFQAV